MLSFIISNALIIINATIGVSHVVDIESEMPTAYHKKAVIESQELVATGKALDATRDNITVNVDIVSDNTELSYNASYEVLPVSNSALVNSAMKYVGMNWDCTALVEQALRDLGYFVPDLGPMSFGQFGTVFYDPSLAEPGDIMMRNGHVAIWAGNGMSVQGGFGFGGVVYNSWEGPESYTAFVRIG